MSQWLFSENTVTIFPALEYYKAVRKAGVRLLRRPRKRKRRCGIGAALAVAAFFGAVMCISFFSLKVLLFAVAFLLIVIGIFLLRC